MKSLGGYVCVRNGERLDYCYELAIKSLLAIPVLSELVVCDSDSDDGTRETLEALAERHPRIKIVNWPWKDPRGVSHHAWIEWLNFARSHLTTDFQITLDADEVLDDREACHLDIIDAICCPDVNRGTACRKFDRLNFWRDPHSLIPEGECCGKWVARMGPTSYPMVSDEPHAIGESRLLDEAVIARDLRIFHLGFLRDRNAFYRKARAVLGMWFDRFDERLEKGEREGMALHETECAFTDRLVPYTGHYPLGVSEWLTARGHKV